MDNPYKDKCYKLNYSNGDESLESIPWFPPTNSTPITHDVIDGETIQSIAFQYYGDSGQWYKIALANNILNPFEEVYEGVTLSIYL